MTNKFSADVRPSGSVHVVVFSLFIIHSSFCTVMVKDCLHLPTHILSVMHLPKNSQNTNKQSYTLI